MDNFRNSYVDWYFEQNDLLARTVVVKLTEAASLINEGLVATYGEDIINTSDPTTWKYYMNLAGEYHSTDERMTVVSIDTLQPIEFTRQALAIHTATAQAHAYGTRLYHTLVARYPKQEGLINSILNPCNIDEAIAASNGTILTYPKDLVESNEATLMLDLEAELKREFARWYNVQFAMSDNLFVATYFTVMHAFILPRLHNLRLARCKTMEAHSFHVRMYLASHGALDRYLPYLTLKQALWLYRNIAYLERNQGKVKQFYTLIEKLLTERKIPIGEYSVRHFDSFTEDYLPVQTARLKSINMNDNSFAKEYQTLEELYEKERPDAEDNPIFLEANLPQYVDQFKTANTAITQTKVLNSSMVDYSGAVPESFEKVALRQWCYMANHDMYPVVVTFKDPFTSTIRGLFAKDAFFYMNYLQLRSEGFVVDTVPQYLNLQQRKHPRPTADDLLKVVDQSKYHLRDVAELIVSRQPIIAPCYSITSFFEHVTRLTEEAYWQWHLISSIEDCHERAMVDNMIRQLYEDVRMDYTLDTTDVQAWLSKNNLPEYDLTYQDAKTYITTIFEAATGRSVDRTKSLRNIQSAMLNLMKELSSYTIQFTNSINTTDIVLINWPSVRAGNLSEEFAIHRQVEAGVDIENVDASVKQNAAVDVSTETDAGSTLGGETPVLIDAKVVVDPITGFDTFIEDYGPAAFADVSYTGQNVAIDNAHELPGYTFFEALPESARLLLRSKYEHH